MVDFIAIDFETANSRMSSACAIGIAVVENGRVAETYYSLIDPHQEFNPTNVAIHGITQSAVKASPTLTELLPAISGYLNEHIPVVAHNAHFDMSVLRSSTDAELPDFVFVDSMEIAMPLVKGSRSLVNCAKELSIEQNNHHNAAEDAQVCAEIALKGIESAGCISMWEYLSKTSHVSISYFSSITAHRTEDTTAAKKADYYRWVKDRNTVILPTVSHIDETGALFGKTVVFTGVLSIDRPTAMQIAVNAGATVKTSVSKKLDYLVVGVQDKALVGDDGMSTKEEKAYALNSSGQASITILNEQQFMKLAGMEACV